MNLAFSKTRSAIGILAQPVSVEVHLSNGLPGFTIVGLAETAVKESKDRVRSAIINSQFDYNANKEENKNSFSPLLNNHTVMLGSSFYNMIEGLICTSCTLSMEKCDCPKTICELKRRKNKTTKKC